MTELHTETGNRLDVTWYHPCGYASHATLPITCPQCGQVLHWRTWPYEPGEADDEYR